MAPIFDYYVWVVGEGEGDDGGFGARRVAAFMDEDHAIGFAEDRADEDMNGLLGHRREWQAWAGHPSGDDAKVIFTAEHRDGRVVVS